MGKAVVCLVAFAGVLMAGSPGIRPRADVASYSSHGEGPDFAVGAVVIPPQQAKKMFKVDMNRAGYVVVEVGVFPAPGKDVDLYPTDFTLFVDGTAVSMRPVSADTVAENIAGRPDTPARVPAPGGIDTAAGASIGHVSYPDPVTGRRTSGTVTETEAGVGIGGAPARLPCRGGYDCDASGSAPPVSQPSPTQSANTISQDLWEKGLPDGKTPRAVAGYLYFPKPPRKAKDAAWELRYENSDDRLRLPLAK